MTSLHYTKRFGSRFLNHYSTIVPTNLKLNTSMRLIRNSINSNHHVNYVQNFQIRTFANKKYDIYSDEGYEEGHGFSHFRRSLSQIPNSNPEQVSESESLEKAKSSTGKTQSQSQSNTTKTTKSNTQTEAIIQKSNSTIVYDSQTYYPPMINHIWSREEIEERKNNQPLHQPKTITDKAMHFLVKKLLYRGFNWLSGFDYENPSPKSCGFRLILLESIAGVPGKRLILLESIAGVPGMVAAVCRHFTSLRTLRRDHGWIHTLLEEAQNERMHLLIVLKKFDAGLGTRLMVTMSQYIMVTCLSILYIIHPKSLHRFVGYLEETAVKTYSDLLRITKTPGTKLNKAWKDSPAPKLAISYWNLDTSKNDPTWVDVLEQLLADESHHRDINHTFADLDSDEPNPFLSEKIKDIENVKSRIHRE